MAENSIQSYIHNLLVKLTKIKKINLNASFVDNKKIDSLDMLNLYSLLEKKYKIKFKSSELAKLGSINKIYQIISNKTNEKKRSRK